MIAKLPAAIPVIREKSRRAIGDGAIIGYVLSDMALRLITIGCDRAGHFFPGNGREQQSIATYSLDPQGDSPPSSP